MAKQIKRTDIVEDGLFDSLKKDARNAKKETDLLELSLEAIVQATERIKKSSSSVKGGILGINRKDIADLQKLNKLQDKAYQNSVNKEKLDKQKAVTQKQLEVNRQTEIKTQILLRKEEERLTKSRQREAKAVKEEGNAYKELTKTTRDLKNESKRLGAELIHLEATGKKGSKQWHQTSIEYKRVSNQALKLDKSLKKIDSRVGDNFRNVGNYKSALKGLVRGMATLAGGFGVFQILRGAGETVINFQRNIADLSAITGASGAELDKYKQKAIDLGKDVQGGASAVVEAFKLIGSAKPELLENSDALIKVADSAILLSKASGLELPEAVTRLTDAMNQFGASAEEADKFVNVLANGAKFGSAEIPQITDALLKFGAVARSSNVPIEESTALIETLAENGLKGAEAGTALRNVMIKMSAPNALPKKAQDVIKGLGISFEELRDPSKSFSERLELLKPLLDESGGLTKVFGAENQIAGQILIENTKRISELNSSMGTLGTSQEQAFIRSQTLAEAGNRLKETWNSWILEMTEGVDASSKMTNALDFLAENLDSIISLVLKLATAYGVYKTALFSVKLVDKIKEQLAYNKAVKASGESSVTAGTGVKAFGQALKSIVILALISALFEMATALYDIASGAREVRETLEVLEGFTKRQALIDEKRARKIQETLKGQLQNLELAKSKGEITNEIFIEQSKSYIASAREQLKVQREMKQETLDGFKMVLKNERVLQKNGENTIKRRAQIESLRENIKQYGAGVDNLTELIGALNDEEFRLTLSQNESAKSSLEAGEAIDSEKDALKDLNDELERNLAIRNGIKELEDLRASGDILKAEQGTQGAFETQLSLAENVGQVDIEVLKKRLDEEFNLKERKLERDKEFRKKLAQDTIQDATLLQIELDRIDEQFTQDSDALNIEETEKRKGLFGQLLKAKDEFREKEKENDEKSAEEKAKSDEDFSKAELDRLKKQADDRQKIIDEVTKRLLDARDERIKAIDDEISASEKQRDLFAQMAINGNITAKESLAEQNQIIEEKNREKANEERKKQQIQMISAILTAFNNNLEAGDDSGTAFTKAVSTNQLLQAFINTIGQTPAFFEGTESTGSGGNLDSNGGFHAILHKDEAVLNAEMNKKKLSAGLTNKSMLEGALQNQQFMEQQRLNDFTGSTQIASGFGSELVVQSLMKVEGKLDNLNKTIENRPVSNWEVGEATQKMFELVNTIKKGNLVTQKTFKVKP